MEFIQHSTNWCKGEIFEALWILFFGILIIFSAFLFYKIGTTPGAKAMLYPLLLIGIVVGSIGSGMIYNNSKRIVEFQKAYEKNPQAFILSEKERTENFISWYPKTRWIFAIPGIMGILVFMFWAIPIGRAIGISLIFMMLTTFVIDHFSEERALIYREKIEEVF